MNTSSLPKASCFFAKTRFQTRKTARILDFLSVCRLGDAYEPRLALLTAWGHGRSWSETKRHTTELPQLNEAKGFKLVLYWKISKRFFCKRNGDFAAIIGLDLFSDLVTFPESLALNFVYPNPSDSEHVSLADVQSFTLHGLSVSCRLIRRSVSFGDVSQVGSRRPRGCPASPEALGSLRPAKARPQWTPRNNLI